MNANYGYPKGNTLDYFKTLQVNEYSRVYGWNLTSHEKNDHSIFIDRLSQVKKFTRVVESHEYNRELTGSYWKLMGRLAYDIWEDLDNCISDEFKEILQTVVIGFLPTGVTNAFCVNTDFNNNNLSGYIIAINAGLFFCSEMLSQSIIAENLTGPLVNYKKSGATPFNNAIDLYLKPTIDNLDSKRKVLYQFDKSIPESVVSEISFYAGALQSIILTFITLHEFGHIALKHLGNNIGVRTFNLITGDAEYCYDKDQAEDHWDYEFLADRYAIEALCLRSKSADTAWNNFASIYFFFMWLSKVEDRANVRCVYHPPSKQRAGRLYEIMKRNYGEPKTDHIPWIDQKLAEWS